MKEFSVNSITEDIKKVSLAVASEDKYVFLSFEVMNFLERLGRR